MDNSSSTFFLLVPRIRVKADWPEMHQRLLQVGDILIQDRLFYRNTRNSELTISVTDAARFPHLFEPLPWYAERKPEEMPQYIKTHPERSTGNAVYKVNGWVEFKGEMRFESDNIHFMSAEYFLPATESEYNAYLQTN